MKLVAIGIKRKGEKGFTVKPESEPTRTEIFTGHEIGKLLDSVSLEKVRLDKKINFTQEDYETILYRISKNGFK